MKTYPAYFNRFEVELTEDQARAASHPGPCDDDVARLALEISGQLDLIDPADLRAELFEYGAWDAGELQNHAENRLRIVWLAACDVRENIDADS